MRPFVILCSTRERKQLIEAFSQRQIATEPCRVKGIGISLVALKVKCDMGNIIKVLDCANDFAQQTDRILQARCDDADGKANPVDVTEKNIHHIVEESKSDLILFLFKDKDSLHSQHQHEQNRFKTIKGIEVPHDALRLWRYMSFDRFEDLIRTSELWFSRIDQFTDFKEGGFTTATSDRADAELPPRLAGLMSVTHQFLNWKYWYASCWNLGETESNLLWRTYGAPKSSDKERFRVAIRTSVSNLLSSIRRSDVFLGKIRYVDFNEDDPYIGNKAIPNGSTVFTKQREYTAEAEVRLAIQDISSMCGGICLDMADTPKQQTCKIHLPTLIEEVVIEAVRKDWAPPGECDFRCAGIHRWNCFLQEEERRIHKVKELVESVSLNGIPIRVSTIL